MSVIEGSVDRSPARPAIRPQILSENVLLAVIAAAFLAFHVLVAVTLMPASAKGPMTPQEEVLSRFCD
jgi:hypothetical protein